MIHYIKIRLIRGKTGYAYLFCLILLFVLSLTGCIREHESGGSISDEIMILPVIAQERITGNNFDPGDQIGLYIAYSPGTPAIDNYAVNIPYIFDGIDWTAQGGSPLLWPGTENLDLYAYWPFDPSLSSGNPRAYDFSIQADQTTRDKYLDNDFLWAQTMGASPGEPVPLQFNHLMARVQLNIRSVFDAGSDWPDGTEIAITGLSNGMVIDLYDGNITPNSSGNLQLTASGLPASGQPPRVLNATMIHIEERLPREDTDLHPFILNVPVEGYDISLAAIVMPQHIQAGVPLIRITLDGNDYAFIPNEDFTFVSGESLTLNLILTDQPPGLILDLDGIDWDQSRVWNVYNGSNIVAQVCREYLQGPSAPDIQAVVIYLASQSGVDFSSGFAARIYQADKNDSGEYDLNPQSIHGGSVDFIASTLYRQGVLMPVRKVSVNPGVGISGSYDEATVNLALKAATVSDYDSNQYPVVKINTWYWTASNLRSTHYRNGTALTARPYNNDAANTDIYGLLYTGYIAYDPQGLLASPWYLPVEEDYEAMLSYLQPLAGSKIKANVLWETTDNSNDVTGFRMLPGGYANGRNVFMQIGTDGYLWTDTYNGFEGTYYTTNALTDNVTNDMISHDNSMSLRFILKVSSALTGIPLE